MGFKDATGIKEKKYMLQEMCVLFPPVVDYATFNRGYSINCLYNNKGE